MKDLKPNTIRNNPGLTESDIRDIISCLSRHPEVESAVLFGSRAMGKFKDGSDVDIALLGKNLSADVVRRISYLLNEETTMPYRFDILNYETIQKQSLKDHINRVGVKVFKRD